MPELFAKPALDVALVTLAGLTLNIRNVDQLTVISAFPGQTQALEKLLKPLGLSFPAPNRVTMADDARLIWTGRGQAMLMGVAPPALGHAAAVTDQTDGWICLSLTGPRADQALMRLVPLDLRATAMPAGATARSGLNHMPLILVRADDGFLILTFRSMARSAWHELHDVLRHMDARDRLPA